MNEGSIRQSLDTAVEVLRERIDNLSRLAQDRFDAARIDASEFEAEVRGNFKDLFGAMKALELRERERNGNIDLLGKRQGEHDVWHGPYDANILARVEAIEQARHDNGVRQSLLKAQWKILTSGLGVGVTIGGAVFYLAERM